MFNIAQYLEKFKKIGGTEREFKEALVFAIKKEVGVEIETKDIIFQQGDVVVKVSPAIKNAIFIKKSKITKTIEEKTGKRVPDIR